MIEIFRDINCFNKRIALHNIGILTRIDIACTHIDFKPTSCKFYYFINKIFIFYIKSHLSKLSEREKDS